MKIFALSYTGYKLDYRINLGDNIQSIAAAKLLPKIDGYVSREALNKISTPCIVSLNGYFMASENWPPSENVIPIPFAFHISPSYEKIICSESGLNFLKMHEPIGCRDQGSTSILKKYGIQAYYSKCVTLTLDKRVTTPKDGKVYVVGVTKQLQKVIPKSILKDAVNVEQSKIELPNFTDDEKRKLAEHLLDDFKKNASLIITSRIHCAMPCIAMGIPVVFLFNSRKKSDYRVHIIEDLVGINYVNESLLSFKLIAKYYSKKINWTPASLDIEDEKARIKSAYLNAFETAKKTYYKRFM
jgi:hypothetical protein